MFPILSIFSDWAILGLRVALGLVLFAHGLNKLKNVSGTGQWMASVGFRPGMLWAVIVTAVEFFGSLALILGLGVKVVALLVAGQFVVIVIWKIFKRNKFIGDLELDLIILSVAFGLLTLGGGAYSLDGIF